MKKYWVLLSTICLFACNNANTNNVVSSSLNDDLINLLNCDNYSSDFPFEVSYHVDVTSNLYSLNINYKSTVLNGIKIIVIPASYSDDDNLIEIANVGYDHSISLSDHSDVDNYTFKAISISYKYIKEDGIKFSVCSNEQYYYGLVDKDTIFKS